MGEGSLAITAGALGSSSGGASGLSWYTKYTSDSEGAQDDDDELKESLAEGPFSLQKENAEPIGERLVTLTAMRTRDLRICQLKLLKRIEEERT